MDILHQRCVSGNPAIKNMFSRILFACHRVFFHQINAWVVHGQLVDIFDEFFIIKMQNTSFSGGAQIADDKSVKLDATQASAISGNNMPSGSSIVSTIMSMSHEAD